MDDGHISDSATEDGGLLTTKFTTSVTLSEELQSESTLSTATDTTESLLQSLEDFNPDSDICDLTQTQVTRVTRTGIWIVKQGQNQGRSSHSTMGYDVDRFPSPVNDGLLCCICRDVLEDPVQAPCEHAYCSACIGGWLVHHSICPEDRQPLTTPELRPLFRYMKNDLDRLQIRCSNTHAGCSEVCNLEFIERHEDECEYHTQECPSACCTVVLERRQLADHLLMCEFRIKECSNGCGLPLLNLEDTEHNCIAELRTSLELLRSEMISKLQDQRQELELRLDAQRRHMVQKQASLVSLVENLKSQMERVLQDVQTLQDSEKRQQEELERVVMEKRELMNILATIQDETRSPSGSSPRKYLCRQNSRQDR